MRRNGYGEQQSSGPNQTLPSRMGSDEGIAVQQQNKPGDQLVSQRASPVIKGSDKSLTAPTPVADHFSLSSEGHVSRFEPAVAREYNRKAQASSSSETSTSRGSAGLLETPPEEDFEWDELDLINYQSPGSGIDVDSIEEDRIKDGMASLAVNEKEAGYLGVASGAALLRILEPDAKHMTPRPDPQYQSRRLPVLLVQPDINRHITDTMIDAYFTRYHLSYPILHEPTFRAQYSEVIPQPHGRSWHVLAYVVAAIGVYSSSTSVGDLDLRLFSHAKSMLSFDFLELGNLTLVQALTLISNLQQKRDKPNSGYNYLGLAVRMAMGLGLHKEFPGWNISPLKMEIRRRVWWSLCVFDVGATITFSRPEVWPYEGVEVSFPLNVTDRVRLIYQAMLPWHLLTLVSGTHGKLQNLPTRE